MSTTKIFSTSQKIFLVELNDIDTYKIDRHVVILIIFFNLASIVEKINTTLNQHGQNFLHIDRLQKDYYSH